MRYSIIGLLLTLALCVAPLADTAQPSAKVATIGYLSMAGGAPGGVPFEEAFRQGLRDLGYVEGKTIAIVSRSAEGQPERLPALSARRRGPAVDLAPQVKERPAVCGEEHFSDGRAGGHRVNFPSPP